MIFKKSAMQGNFIFSNGEQALFVNGYYETEDAVQISQLEKIYEKVESKPEAAQEKESAQPAVTKGTASSATLAALTQANK